MFDQDLEDKEIDLLTKKLERALVSLDERTIACLCEFIHTSLFGYKRCGKVELKQDDLLRTADGKVSVKRFEHFKDFCDKMVPRWFLKAHFNEQLDDVEYIIYPDPGPIKPHHIKAIHDATKAYVEIINNVRQSARIEYNHLWREYRKNIQNK